MSIDPSAKRLLRMLAAASSNDGRTAPTVKERRQALEFLTQIGEEAPDGRMETRELTLSGPGGPLGARLYEPDPGPSAGAVVYLHGGGWVAGGLGTHDGVCRRLARSSGAKVIAVDYRLAPEHPFPAALEDALAALRWAGDKAGELGFDPERLAIAGDSAGGGLAAVVAQSHERPALALQVLICPILNLAEESVSRLEFAEGYFLDRATLAADVSDYCGDGTSLRDARLSPLLADDLSGLPPALIHSAEYDPFRDEAEAYAARLTESGAPTRLTRHRGMIHYFYALTRAIPRAQSALEALGSEIAKALVEGVR